MQENDFLLQKHHDNKENNARWVIKIIKNQDKHIKVTLAKGFPYPVCVAHLKKIMNAGKIACRTF